MASDEGGATSGVAGFGCDGSVLEAIQRSCGLVRYILLDNRKVKVVSHGGSAGLGLECTRAALYELIRERIPGFAYGVSDVF